MKQIHIQYRKTKIGEIILGSLGDNLCLLDYRYRRMRSTVDNRLRKSFNAEFKEQENDILSEAGRQLDEYLDGKRMTIDVPIETAGTDFQQDVWKALMDIPYGRTSSYLELAQSINRASAVRAVAQANGANALAIIIPCHRIIGNNGELIGYGGGLAVKKRLLNLEQRTGLQINVTPHPSPMTQRKTTSISPLRCPGEGNEPQFRECPNFLNQGTIYSR